MKEKEREKRFTCVYECTLVHISLSIFFVNFS